MAGANPPVFPAHECGKDAPVFKKQLRHFEICSVSGGALMDPWTASCGHSYCGNFVIALKEAEMDTFNCMATSSNDPSVCCNSLVKVSEMYQDGSLAFQMEKKLVKCTKHELGCTEFVMYRKMAEHHETSCMYVEQQCPSCRLKFQRRKLVEHTNNCKRKACEFAELGCTHMLDVSNPDEPVTCSELGHNDGLHLALIYRELAKAEALNKFRSEPLEDIIERHKKELDCQEQILHMINHPEEQREEMLSINELYGQVDRAIRSAESALKEYNSLVHFKYPHEVGQPAKQLHNKAKYMKDKESRQRKLVDALTVEAKSLPVLHNYGHTIVRLTDFAEQYERQTTAEFLDVKENSVTGEAFYTNQFGPLLIPRIFLAGTSGDAHRHGFLSISLTLGMGPYDAVVNWPIKLGVVVSLLPHTGTNGLPITKRLVTDDKSPAMQRMNPAHLEHTDFIGFEQFCKCDMLFPPSPYNVNNEVFFEIKTTRLPLAPNPPQQPHPPHHYGGFFVQGGDDQAPVEDVEGGVEDAEGGVEDVEGGAEDAEGGVEDAEGGAEDAEGGVEDAEGGEQDGGQDGGEEPQQEPGQDEQEEAN